jgi:subtilisin family serine protease
VRHARSVPQLTRRDIVTSAEALAEQAWHLSQINKPRRLSGAGVRIGVIDTGYDPALPDLAAPFSAQFAEWRPAQPAGRGPQATKPMMVAGVPPRDLSNNLHGSTVCAFLAGTISGVAPGASVTVAAVPGSSVLTTQAQFMVALNWLLTLRLDLITTSLSTGVVGQVPALSAVGRGPSLETVEQAIEGARMKHGVLVIAATGNIGAQGRFQHPGSSIQTFGVGAVDAGDALFGSAWGTVAAGVHKPDIVAPGYQLRIPTPNGGVATVGGTSFAAAIVAGAAALVLEKHPELRGNPAALSAKLRTLVRPVKGKPPKNSTGAGLLDLSSL